MAAVIDFNGVRLTVPISELGAAVLELRRVGVLPELTGQLLGTKPLPLPSSAAQLQPDLIDLIALREPKFAAGIPRKASEIKAARNFLAMVAKLNLSNKRAETSSALEIFEVKHSKGLGSKLAALNRLLDASGYAIPDVYTTERDAHGSFWRAGPHIAAAINALAEKALIAEELEQGRLGIDDAPPASDDQKEKEEQVQPQHNEKSP